MFLHPIRSLDLILEAIIQTCMLLNFSTSQKKTIQANPIVEGHDNNAHIGRFYQAARIVVSVGVAIESSTLNPKEDREA